MINKLYILLFCLIPLVEYAQVNYETEIQPIFNGNCIGCHSGGFPSGGLNLTNLDGVLAGSNSGPVIIEGSPFSYFMARGFIWFNATWAKRFKYRSS